MGHALDAHRSRARNITASETDGSKVCGTITVEAEDDSPTPPEESPDDGPNYALYAAAGAAALGLGAVVSRR